jgi:hypothetical protein
MVKAHGTATILVDGDIITVTPSGSFNEEGITKVIADLTSVIESFDQKSFKLLFDYTQTQGGTPEVYEKINDCNVWLNTQRLNAKAIIINSRINLAILERRTPARHAQNTQCFEDKVSALTWLKLQS